jgi:DNA-binding response OmpR family regulator
VEDEPHLRLLYENELRHYGYNTLAARDGNQCLEYLLAMEIDLIVLDVRLPGMDGIDLLYRLRGQERKVPIIINTAYSSYANNYLTWAADAFVVKSADLTELVDKVRQLTRSSRES